MKHAALLLAAALLSASCVVAPAARAQGSPELESRTMDGRAFSLASLKGKVVLVMFWSTGCAVCRDKMPELRQNVQGWKDKPFELVLVSTDRSLRDLDAYEQIIARTVPVQQRFVQLWAGQAGYRDSFGAPGQLPAAFLIDKAGRLVERWQGRIPVEAWDRIAELL